VFPCSLADADYLTLRANLQQRQSSLGVAAQRKGASQVAAKAARAALAAATQSAAKAAVASALSQARREQASICRERAQAQAAQKAAAKAAELAKSLLAQRAERAERAQCRERRDPRAIWLSQCAAKAHQQAAGLLETEAPQSALGQQAATLSIRGRVAAELRGAAAGTAVAAGSGALQLEHQMETGHSGPPARPRGRREPKRAGGDLAGPPRKSNRISAARAERAGGDCPPEAEGSLSRTAVSPAAPASVPTLELARGRLLAQRVQHDAALRASATRRHTSRVLADLAAAGDSLRQLADAVAAGTPSVAPERTAASDTLQVVRKALEAARCEATAAEVTRDFKVAVEAARYAKELAAIANREQDGKAYTRAYNNIFQRKRRAPPANPSQICRASPIELVLILADLAAAEGSLGQLADAVAAGTPSVAPERTAASNALQAAREALTAASCEGTAAEIARAIEVAVEAARDAKELAAIANRNQDGKACRRARDKRRNRRKPDPLAPILADLAATEGSLGQLADAVAAGTPSVAPERTAASKACRLRARRSPRRAARGQLPRLLAPSRSPSRQHATPRSSRPSPTARRTGRRAGELATNGVTGASLTPSPRSSPTWRPRRARWAS